MARIAKSVVSLTIVLLVASCATTTVAIERDKNQTFSEPLTKLYVEVDVGDWKCSYNAGSKGRFASSGQCMYRAADADTRLFDMAPWKHARTGRSNDNGRRA